MNNRRKTRKQKIASSERKVQNAFVVKEEWLSDATKKAPEKDNSAFLGTKYLRQDLTKTFVLTMLVLALELALWLYLSRQ